ncbi:MAG TPA: hypothetical protein VJ324_12975 [Candidatus Acidoferrum sp.]|nr:hypothetical protein [Candidatus Acidoferrum sp.]
MKKRLGIRFAAVVVVLALASLPLFAQSKIVERWVLTGLPMPPIKKILVIAALENYLIRQEFEDEMEKLLAKSGVEGVRSHMVLPPRNELMEGEMKERIKEGGYDAVLVVRPRAVRTETEEVVTGVAYVPPPGYYNFWPYWQAAYREVVISSYLKENTIVRAEFNLYNTRDEKLLWNGESDTVYSKDFGKLGKSYAKMLVNQLKKDKVIGKK